MVTKPAGSTQLFKGSNGNYYKVVSRKNGGNTITAHLMLGTLPSGQVFRGGPKYANGTRKMLETLVIFKRDVLEWYITDIQSYKKPPNSANLSLKSERDLVTATINNVAATQLANVRLLSHNETVDFGR